MNYCSLEDAWGGGDRICNEYKNYMDDKNNQNINPQKKSSVNNIQNIEHFSDLSIQKNTHILNNDDNHFDELNNCDNFLNHIRNCRKCHNKVKNYFKPKLVENFQDIVEDNKDTIVLILIGISILLFFNLINNMTKN